MKKLLMIALFIVAFSMIANAQPKLEIVGGDVYDWGEITINDNPLHTKVMLKNAGTDTLFISRVKPTCGCTTAPLSKDLLAPGETAEMNVTLRVSENLESVTKTVHIYTNDPQNEKSTLFLKAKLRKPIKILPNNYFRFTDMTVGNEANAVVQLINNTDKELILGEMTIEPEDLLVDIPGTGKLQPNEAVTVTAKVTPKQVGYFSCQVVIKTNNEEMPELKIQGYGSVKESPIFVR
jgi:uncharacterized membrane protein